MTADSSAGRPVEIHLQATTVADREAMPLVSSLVHGELLAAEMLNKKSIGTRKPGIVSGFEVVPNGGMEILIRKDSDEDISVAIIDMAKQYFHIFQQHDITLGLANGFKWFVVLEAFYEQGVFTKQVAVDAENDAVRIRKLQFHEVEEHHQVLCEVDLTGNPSEIKAKHITFDYRIESGGIDLDMHNDDPNAHPGLIPSVNYIYTPDDKIELGRVNVFMGPMEYELPYLPEENGYMVLGCHPSWDASRKPVTISCELNRKFVVNKRKFATITLETDNREVRLYTDPEGWWLQDDQAHFNEASSEIPKLINEDTPDFDFGRDNIITEDGTYYLEEGDETVQLNFRADSALNPNSMMVIIKARDESQIFFNGEYYDEIKLETVSKTYNLVRIDGKWRL